LATVLGAGIPPPPIPDVQRAQKDVEVAAVRQPLGAIGAVAPELHYAAPDARLAEGLGICSRLWSNSRRDRGGALDVDQIALPADHADGVECAAVAQARVGHAVLAE